MISKPHKPLEYRRLTDVKISPESSKKEKFVKSGTKPSSATDALIYDWTEMLGIIMSSLGCTLDDGILS